MSTMTYKNQQDSVDLFYQENGPCCAGCDWWRRYNSVAGECHRTVPVCGADRAAMLGITGSSLPIGAGHIMTNRAHLCGEFQGRDNAGGFVLSGTAS